MRHASLFSGIGGPEVAATMLGWENVFHCEINEFAQKVLKYWYPNSVSYGDIKETDFREWEGKIDVLSAGFPCQPFSYAGQRRGAEDDRYLWPEMLRVIKEVKPTWVVGENVIGITTMVEQGEVVALGCQGTLFGEDNDISGYYELRERFTIERICEDIEGVGYEVQPFVIPACAVGARTEETECSLSDTVLLQTPTSVQTDETPESMRARAEKNGYKNGTKFGSLTSQLKYDERVKEMLLPTPIMLKTPCAADNYTDNMKSRGVSGTSGTLAQEVVSGYATEHRGLTLPDADDGTLSRLSPLFTEEMMGFPSMWLTLPFLSHNGEQNPSKPMEMQ